MTISPKLLLIGLLSIFLYACGGGESQTASSDTTAQDEGPSVAPTVELTIEGNDQMRYNKERLEVFAGQKVTLTLKHVGQLPVAAMGHNWVLLAQGTDVETFAVSAVSAADNDYIPAGSGAEVIAHTKMIGGGEEVSIEFDAPAAGTYDFICTFPGHYGFMKGKFVVTEM